RYHVRRSHGRSDPGKRERFRSGRYLCIRVRALTTAIATKIVTVIDHGTDIYGRMLGTIWLDGYDINASMVDSGYAWVYRFEDNAIVPGYIKYESAAQKEAKGLWADTNPVPPWQWRQANEKPRKVKEKK
ncbi:thermonuclease family protein, partial [Salmonella enterica]